MRKKILILLAALSVLLTGVPAGAAEAQETQPEKRLEIPETSPEEKAEVYGIGSVSKMFGAAAVMLLADRGTVELDAPVTDYIPEFEMADSRYRQITVRMLLNHSSGIMGTTYQDCFLLGDTDRDYHRTLLEALKGERLKADPGEYGVYCNDGFTLAEIIVERASGLSFAEFVRREFSGPLGMEDTYMPEELTGSEILAPVYYQHRRTPYENIQSLASGGIYSTPKDLCRFARIFTEDGAGILSPDSVEAMRYPEYLRNRICLLEGDSNFGYGLGWDCVEVFPFSNCGLSAQSKGGDTGNYGAGLLVLPDQKLSVAVTASGGGSELSLLMAQEIAAAVLLEEGLITDAQLEEAATPGFNSVETAAIPEEFKRYEGVYAAGELWRVEFTGGSTARVTALENDRDMVQEYVYTRSGDFVSTEGKYISYNQLAQAADGISGLTAFHFSEEPNGKTYMLGTTYKLVNGKAQSAATQPFAEKIEENVMSGETARAWEERDGKKYYLVSDTYNSVRYLGRQSVKVELLKAFPGYTSATEEYKNCRIADASHAVCELDLPVMTGRDLADYRFYREDGIEFADIGGDTYMDGDAVLELSGEERTVTMGSRGRWYRIGDRDGNRELTVEVPEKGAYYVYDRNDVCVTASFLEGEQETVRLPESGKLLLVGEEGSVFTLLWPDRG